MSSFFNTQINNPTDLYIQSNILQSDSLGIFLIWDLLISLINYLSPFYNIIIEPLLYKLGLDFQSLWNYINFLCLGYHMFSSNISISLKLVNCFFIFFKNYTISFISISINNVKHYVINNLFIIQYILFSIDLKKAGLYLACKNLILKLYFYIIISEKMDISNISLFLNCWAFYFKCTNISLLVFLGNYLFIFSIFISMLGLTVWFMQNTKIKIYSSELHNKCEIFLYISLFILGFLLFIFFFILLELINLKLVNLLKKYSKNFESYIVKMYRKIASKSSGYGNSGESSKRPGGPGGKPTISSSEPPKKKKKGGRSVFYSGTNVDKRENPPFPPRRKNKDESDKIYAYRTKARYLQQVWIRKTNRPPLTVGFDHGYNESELKHLNNMIHRQSELLEASFQEYETAFKSNDRAVIKKAELNTMASLATYDCNMRLINKFLDKKKDEKAMLKRKFFLN